MDGSDPARRLALQQALEKLSGLVLVSVREPTRLGRRAVFGVDVAKPTAREQRDIWLHALGEQASRLDGAVDRLADQFDLSTVRIETACLDALGTLSDGRQEPVALERALWEACRAQARPRLADLAGRVEARADWDDLVVPDTAQRTLRQVAAHVRHRARVYQEWRFAEKSTRGLGISALFAGPSGTGKTMAAEVLARDLQLDLYHIDLSATVSKYIGETEKNLRRIFDAAEEGGAILLFDEADAAGVGEAAVAQAPAEEAPARVHRAVESANA